MSSCTYEFETVTLTEDASNSDTFTSTLALVEAVLPAVGLGNGDGDFLEYFSTYFADYLTGFIWPLLFLAFLILAFLPTSIARCCCPKLCCKPVADNVIPGYPACGCCGYSAPTIVWLIVFIGLCALSIYCPFAFGAVGNALVGLVSAICGIADSISDLFGQISQALDAAASAVDTAISGLLANLSGLLDQLSVDVTSIQNTLTNISDSLVAGCENITSSQEYQELQSLTTSVDFDCNQLSAGSSTQAEVDTINSTIQSLRDTINDFDIDTSSFVNEARDQIQDLETEITGQLTSILSEPVDLGLDGLPVALPSGSSSGTLEEILTDAAAAFPSVMALLLLFNWIGLAFWLLGFLLIACVKGSAKSTPRSKEVKNGCCGRCSMKTGCVCSYWAAFLLCFTATIVLLFAFAFNRVADFYYYAPFNANEVLSLLQATDVLPDAAQYASIIQGCFFEDASLAEIAAVLGFNVTELIGQLTDQEFSLGESFDLDSVLDDARNAVASGKSALVTEKYSSAEVAIAERAATYCCDYEPLFELFTSDCSSASSVCYQCQFAADNGDCTDPTPCSPTPAQNGGLSESCNDLAKSALFLMTSKNSLIEAQEPKMDSITSTINDVAARDLVGTADGYIESSLDSVSSSISSELDALTCSEVVDIYYGIYTVFLEPLASSLTAWGSVMAAIIGVIILLVYVSIPVNVRLGNDGIDLNNLDPVGEAPSQSTNESEVTVEMVNLDKPENSLPVAEVVDQGAGDTRSPQYEYNNEKIDEYGGNDDYEGGYPEYGGTPRV